MKIFDVSLNMGQCITTKTVFHNTPTIINGGLVPFYYLSFQKQILFPLVIFYNNCGTIHILDTNYI
jgi:hypothetical protein